MYDVKVAMAEGWLVSQVDHGIRKDGNSVGRDPEVR